MLEQLKEILLNESHAIEELTNILEEQHDYIAKNNIFELEDCVKKIENCNRNIAQWEVKRREITKGESMKIVIGRLNDSELEQSYRNIKKLLHAAMLQKDLNETLLKQGLGFSSKMLNLLNPDKRAKTYTSYGAMKR